VNPRTSSSLPSTRILHLGAAHALARPDPSPASNICRAPWGTFPRFKRCSSVSVWLIRSSFLLYDLSLYAALVQLQLLFFASRTLSFSEKQRRRLDRRPVGPYLDSFPIDQPFRDDSLSLRAPQRMLLPDLNRHGRSLFTMIVAASRLLAFVLVMHL